LIPGLLAGGSLEVPDANTPNLANLMLMSARAGLCRRAGNFL
jgi:hypothetical protein